MASTNASKGKGRAVPGRGSTDKGKGGQRQQKSVVESTISPEEDSRRCHAREESIVPLELQQSILDVFRTCFPMRDQTNLSSLLQVVKQHLYNRDFKQAFAEPQYLEAYAVRWSAGRALAYLQVFAGLPDIRDRIAGSCRSTAATMADARQPFAPKTDASPDSLPYAQNHLQPSSEHAFDRGFKVVCLGGGGGAEIVALAGFTHYFQSSSEAARTREKKTLVHQTVAPTVVSSTRVAVAVVDIAGWLQVVETIQEGVTGRLRPSNCASTPAKAAYDPLVQRDDFSCTYLQRDILELGVEELATLLENVTMVTLMFTLNELYSTSMSKTTNLLLALTYLLEPGTLLLVVDSAGSYSTVDVGNSGGLATGSKEKKYPMQWLLDHTLLEASAIGSSTNTTESGQWEKLVSDESRWFRLPKGLEYPVALENMRYQAHLYRHK